MSVLGFNFAKGHFRYCLLDGTIPHPNLLDKGRLQCNPDEETSVLMNWYRVNFEDLINRLAPDQIAYRMFWKISKQDQAKQLLFPIGVLNGVCFAKNLPVSEFGNQAITAKKLGLPKGAKPIRVCDQFVGAHPPNWDDHQRNAALAAWLALPA